MAEFRLPKNSRVTKGKTHPAEDGKRLKTFKIYRYDPDSGANPRYDTYTIDLDKTGPMVLDALIRIKNEIDSDPDLPPLVPRGDLRILLDEHGRPQRARLHHRDRGHEGRRPDHSAAAHGGGEGPRSRPDPRLRPICVDPALAEDGDPGPVGRERLQSPEDREKLDGLYECILCFCCSTGCPSYWWNSDRFLGPAVLLQAYRWIADSRDEATGERLDELEDPFRLYRCHTIMNCANVCPKGLNPAKAIAETKKLIAERAA